MNASISEPYPRQSCISHGQGGVCDRAHCSTSRWPLLTAWLHTHSFHGAGGVCDRSYCNTSIQPVLAAVVHALSSHGQGGVCDRHHCRIRRWPLRAATVHTISFPVYGGVATEPNTICANGQKQQPLGTQTSPNRNGLSEATGGLLNSQTSQPMYVPFL